MDEVVEIRKLDDLTLLTCFKTAFLISIFFYLSLSSCYI